MFPAALSEGVPEEMASGTRCPAGELHGEADKDKDLGGLVDALLDEPWFIGLKVSI